MWDEFHNLFHKQVIFIRAPPITCSQCLIDEASVFNKVPVSDNVSIILSLATVHRLRILSPSFLFPLEAVLVPIDSVTDLRLPRNSRMSLHICSTVLENLTVNMILRMLFVVGVRARATNAETTLSVLLYYRSLASYSKTVESTANHKTFWSFCVRG